MTKALIFDLNGVFIVSPKLSDRFESDFGISTQDFLPVLKEILDQVRMPNAMNIYSLWEPHLKEWNINLNETELLNYWFGAEKENNKLTSLARKLKANCYKIYSLSNNFRERAEYYDATFPFMHEIFDRIYYSWQTGFVKPDPDALLNILKDSNLDPKECIYFDDNKTNIEVAKSLGIKSYIFGESSISMLESLID